MLCSVFCLDWLLPVKDFLNETTGLKGLWKWFEIRFQGSDICDRCGKRWSVIIIAWNNSEGRLFRPEASWCGVGGNWTPLIYTLVLCCISDNQDGKWKWRPLGSVLSLGTIHSGRWMGICRQSMWWTGKDQAEWVVMWCNVLVGSMTTSTVALIDPRLRWYTIIYWHK